MLSQRVFLERFAIPHPLATRYWPLGYALLIPALDPRKSVRSAQSVFHSPLCVLCVLETDPEFEEVRAAVTKGVEEAELGEGSPALEASCYRMNLIVQMPSVASASNS